MAILANKLRVGNIVSHKGQMITVTNVHRGLINYAPAQGADEGYPLAELDNLKCVPEMLIEFGFEKKRDTYDRAIPNDTFGLIGVDDSWYYLHRCGMRINVVAGGNLALPGHDTFPITHISQLQNIALDLFNFDFKINLEG